MKIAPFLKVFSIIIGLSLLNACYEPIANTSGGSDESPKTNVSESNTSSEIMENTDNNSSVSEQNNASETSNKTESKAASTTEISADGFRGNLSQNLSRNGLSVSGIYDSSSSVESRILDEYGAVFLTKATPPSKVMFTSEDEVTAFQSKAGMASANIGGTNIELQSEALKALQDAVSEAKSKGLSITPRDGSEAARRTFDKTLELWKSRFEPALKHWRSKGRLNDEQISQLRSMPIKQQVDEVLKLEKQGIYFNTFFNNSILYSVAAPGTSQHLSMLAFDATEFGNKKVREIMANHGWFRTVQNDEPHFTYLGHKESDLPKLGLKKVMKKGTEFWIPNV